MPKRTASKVVKRKSGKVVASIPLAQGYQYETVCLVTGFEDVFSAQGYDETWDHHQRTASMKLIGKDGKQYLIPAPPGLGSKIVWNEGRSPTVTIKVEIRQ